MYTILIALKDMKIGGIEKSAIELLKFCKLHGYQITLLLEERKGEFLNKVPNEINIIEYKPCKIKGISKLINVFKRIGFIIKHKDKYDISISYATYSRTCSFVAKKASKNSILWCHADYLQLYNGNEKNVHEFFEQIHYEEFSKIVFVSQNAKDTFLKAFPMQKNVYFCNNLIDSKEIYEKANQKINLKYNKGITTFLNVGRHDEKQKKLSRIIQAAMLLKQDGYKFKIIFVGDGPDTEKYIKLVKKNNLQQYIIFEGKKENPYPYYKIADCIVLSSDYEGYPVVFLESYVLNKPIITTKVSDYQDILKGRGIVTEKTAESIYKAMKEYMEYGYKLKNTFNSVKYNTEIEKKLNEIFKNS